MNYSKVSVMKGVSAVIALFILNVAGINAQNPYSEGYKGIIKQIRSGESRATWWFCGSRFEVSRSVIPPFLLFTGLHPGLFTLNHFMVRGRGDHNPERVEQKTLPLEQGLCFFSFQKLFNNHPS